MPQRLQYTTMPDPLTPGGTAAIAVAHDDAAGTAEVIGALRYTNHPLEQSGRVLIHFVFVKEEWRSQGIYATLVDHVIRLLSISKVTVTAHIPASAAVWYRDRGVYVNPGPSLDEHGTIAERVARRAMQATFGANALQELNDAYQLG
jgi:GNAT superfamily N-acetyltransferase